MNTVEQANMLQPQVKIIAKADADDMRKALQISLSDLSVSNGEELLISMGKNRHDVLELAVVQGENVRIVKTLNISDEELDKMYDDVKQFVDTEKRVQLTKEDLFLSILRNIIEKVDLIDDTE